MKRLSPIVCVLVIVAAALAQQRDTDDLDRNDGRRGRFERLRQQSGDLLDGLSRLGPWEEQYNFMMDAMERVFHRNGWDSEPDLYALDLVREVEALPPADFMGRFNTLTQMLGDRYLLTEDQERRLGQMAARETIGVFMRHSDEIMDYSMDMINTRGAGKAFTPEQVARWAKLSAPVLKDAHAHVQASVERFMRGLEPEQRELMQRDLDAAGRRVERIQKLSKGWAKGKWRASDWGMENDPIQVAGELVDSDDKAAAASERATAVSEKNNRGHSAGEDRSGGQTAAEKQVVIQHEAGDDEWAAYVKSFIRKYRLNEAQQNRAWAIYRDVKSYGDKVRKRSVRKIADLDAKRREAQSAESKAGIEKSIRKAGAPLRRVFDQMKRRLDRLPTRSQRRNADTSEPTTKTKRAKANRGANGP